MADVAEAAKCSPAMVTRLERRQRVPSEDLGKRVAKAVGIDPRRWKTLQFDA